MKPDRPTPALIPQLRDLWKEAFGDTDAFLDLFFGIAYDPARCLCLRSQDRVTAALYWLDVFADDQKFAYIYAVATAADCRGQGLCRQLMRETAALLTAKGYHGALLVPQDEGLRTMYGRMGYRNCAPMEEFFCAAGDIPLSVREITAEEYAALRPAHLPEGSIRPGSEVLTLLTALARFYAGDGFLAAVSREPEHLRILEYLGDPFETAPLIAALGHREATVRTPGTGTPFAMYRPLSAQCTRPEYFAFCFD